jgi:hypothetical protein
MLKAINVIKTTVLTLLFFLSLTLISCKKKVVEKTAVIEYENISVPDTASVKYFSFPTQDIGYAAAGLTLYKTNDGGKNWVTLKKFNSSITGVGFIDAGTGFCISNGTLFKTDNAGQSWSSSIDADFLDISASGTLVTVEKYALLCDISSSNDKGVSFTTSQPISIDGDLTGLRTTNNRAFVLETDLYSRHYITGVNLLDSNRIIRAAISANAYENPNDLFIGKTGYGAAVGLQGWIANGYISNTSKEYSAGSFSRSYYGHTYPFNSIDGYDALMVAVGRHTIATNLDLGNDEAWNEVFDKGLNGFPQTFYRIRFINSNTFIVSGNNGLIWRATI